MTLLSLDRRPSAQKIGLEPQYLIFGCNIAQIERRKRARAIYPDSGLLCLEPFNDLFKEWSGKPCHAIGGSVCLD